MVRSDQPLIERMTLMWHSWFATSVEASNAQLMIRQRLSKGSYALYCSMPGHLKQGMHARLA